MDSTPSDEYVKSVEVGLKLAAKQSVTTAIRTLAQTPENVTSGEGGIGAQAASAASGALQAVSAAQQISNPSASVSATVGLSMSESSFSSDSATSVPSTITAGRDVALDAGQDLTVEGGRVQAAEDVSLTAGEDVTVASAANSRQTLSSSSSVSAGVGIGATVSAVNGTAAGLQVSGSASGSDADYRADSNTNAQVAAGQDLTVQSGQDTTVAGANLEGNTVNMDVGGDLVVASRQDTSESKSSNWNVGGSATLGMGASMAADAADTVGLNPTDSTGDSASVGMGKGTGSSAWVHNQTSIIGKEQVDIRVEDNTHVEGAVIAAENGNLKLDTDTLTYNDIYDHDKASNYQASLSVSKSAENAKNSANRQGSDDAQASADSSQEGASNDANQEGNPYSGTLEGDYSSHDRRQINRATIGEGEIIIRSDPDAGLEGLNRDLAKAQEITKDEKTSVTVYIDSAAIEEIMSGGEGIKNNFNKVAEKIKELLPEDAESMREVIQSQQDFRDQLEKEGIDPNEADKILGENAVAAVLKEKLDKYLTESGELNLTEEQAEDLLQELQMDPTVVLQVASTWDYDLQTERARLQRQLFSIVGIAKSAGATAKGALMFLNEYSGEIFYSATGGALFKAEHESFHETVNEVVAAIGKLATTDPGESLKALCQVYNGRLDQYYKLVEEGKHDEAGLVMGSLMYDVAEALAFAGKGILKGTTKLAGLMKRFGKGAGAIKVVDSLVKDIKITNASVITKLDNYLLESNHPKGGAKAKWFWEALGFDKKNINILAQQIVFDSKQAYQTGVTQYGTKYNQVIKIIGENGKKIDVNFAWIKNLDGNMRLVTAIPTKKR
ncbi:hemagglutinin repeat-containing protein [Pseudodesulfovibrio thermohalotolerans]|uniref:hemagglutinin repeat-containing protein n=1 Tax=Pseudodesulfovibrio thermohalotolerans TaxID=2880651 RepID=UPI0024417E8F|nr:hemagglutinin repeat-containing protein [Pseudodesulfovibrio thermohalotolerans]WFS63380.1 hemagglutinin repeat-containing protein [Pseudodesulfovibrio thermohalotolerans]